MKNYSDFPKQYIGQSDILSLALMGCDRTGTPVSRVLNFSAIGAYKAYVVRGTDVSIGSQFEEKFIFHDWLRIYDDNGLTYKTEGSLIRIYQAGGSECIIQII